MNNLTELIQKRIAQIEANQRALAAEGTQLETEPLYSRDDMLIGMNAKALAVNSREWKVLKSLLNGGLAAEDSCFPPFGSYLYTDRDGNQSAFTIKEFFFKSPNNEYARVQWLNGKEEDLYVHFFIGANLKPIEMGEVETV